MALSIAHPSLPHVNAQLADFSQRLSHRIIPYLQGSLEAPETTQNILRDFYREVEALASSGEPVEDAASELESPLGVMWTLFLELVIQIPYDHPYQLRLINLLGQIKTQSAPAEPAVSAAAASILSHFQQSWGQSFWAGLPVFGMTVHDTQSRDPAHAEEEVHLGFGGQSIPADFGEAPYSQSEWKSLQAFFGLCKSGGVMDLQLDA